MNTLDTPTLTPNDEMIPSPIKRSLTDDEHATRLASQFQRSDALPDDLTASIRAASMRARKTVTEGYLSPPSSSPTTPYSSPLKQAPSSIPASRFPLSARDASRQVFSSFSGRYTPLHSPSKRKRPDIDPHELEDDELPIISIPDEQSEDREMVAEFSGDDMEVDRPMKPLRRSTRLWEASSLPVRPSPPATDMNLLQCNAGKLKNIATIQEDV